MAHPADRLGQTLLFPAVLVLAAGCGGATGVHDAAALAQARSLVVLPAVGALGPQGTDAGAMQAGVLVTALSNLKHFSVQGPGALRKAAATAAQDDACKAQADVAKDLNADLLVVAEVTDYRTTTENHSAWFLVGSSAWTESNFHVAVNVRLLSPSGKMVYSGAGQAASKEGYGPAVLEATDRALAELKEFLRTRAQRSGA